MKEISEKRFKQVNVKHDITHTTICSIEHGRIFLEYPIFHIFLFLINTG